MADYIYLLENRLTLSQRRALDSIRDLARTKGATVFLVGGAVRDLTSGSPVRDLDVVVQGSVLKWKKELEKAGAIITGEQDSAQTVYLRFPGGVRVELGSMAAVTYPKPGKPVVRLASLQEDLRRRDFTANAMALSLNEGSYGLLMDPLNGVADIENRELRLVSPYSFIEDPARMIRAARLMARLGWTLEEKTQSRYETGKQEGYISALSDFQRGYELEEIVHEEDPLRVLNRLSSEGWMKYLAPYWTPAKANAPELDRLREVQMQLELQGIHADTSSANFPLLTAKLSAKEIAQLKSEFPRTGFTVTLDTLDQQARTFAAQLSGKAATAPSQSWQLIMSAPPEVVLWTAFTTKSPALQAKFKSFSTEWPQSRARIPYTLMQEMRITPELPDYEQLAESLFFALMDGKLETTEEMKSFLEPHSPPAPPPPVSLRKPRAAKKESKPARSRAKKSVPESPDTPDAPPESSSISPAPAVSPVPPPPPAVAKAAPSKPVPAPPAPQKAIPQPPAKSPARTALPPVKAAAKPAPAKAPKNLPTAKKAPQKPLTPVKKSAAKQIPANLPPKPASKLPAKKIPAPARKTTPAKPAPRQVSAGAGKSALKAKPAAKPSAGKPAAKKTAPKPAAKGKLPVKAAAKAAVKAPPKKAAPGKGTKRR